VDVLILCAKTAVACLLIVAGGAKLSDPASFASTMRLFIPLHVAWRLLWAMAVGVSLAELAVGLASLTLPAVTALNLVSALGYAFHRGRSCRCFGSLSQRKFTATGVLRSAIIASIAAVALGHVGAAALQLDVTARVLLLAAAGLLALAAYTAARARGTGREPEPEVVAQ